MEESKSLYIEGDVVTGTRGGVEHEKIVLFPDFITAIGKRALRFGTEFRVVILPDSLKRIGERAFENLSNLEKIYIPKSVEVIEENAFKGCTSLKIYCEGEPKEQWIDRMETRTERDYYVTPEDDAFNFHRSSGSWTSHYTERTVEVYVSYNPDHAEIFTNVTREEFEKLI